MTKIKVLLVFFLFINIATIWAQEFEFGIVAGGGNYIGDIGREYYFYPNKIGGGLVFKQTVNPWYSFRFNLNFFQIEANDADAISKGRNIRNFMSDAKIIHFSAGVEYNFMPRNPFLTLRSLHKFTPYFYTGLGLGNYFGNIISDVNTQKMTQFSGTNLNIPIILGIKYKLSPHFILGFESGAYYFLTDNLDGTNAFFLRDEKEKPNPFAPAVNTHSNDWYTFSSVSFIYTFGDLSCYFNLF